MTAADRGGRARVRVAGVRAADAASASRPATPASSRSVLASPGPGASGQEASSLDAWRSRPPGGWRAREAATTRSGSAPVGIECESRRPDGPGAGRQAGRLLGDAIVHGARAPGCEVGEPVRPLLTTSAAVPSPASAKPRSGCSQQNQRSPPAASRRRSPSGRRDRRALRSRKQCPSGPGTAALEFREERTGVEGDAHPRP